MRRLILLVPFVAAIGCDESPSTKAPGHTVSSIPSRPAEPTAAPPAVTFPDGATVRPAEVARKDDAADERPFRGPEIEEHKELPPEEAPPIPAGYKPLNEKKTLFFEKGEGTTRRVHLLAAVCLREGPLEVLVCKMGSKEHESILHVDADGREIHFALVAAGAVAGSPVKFVPEYTPATGTKIKVSLTYREKGKVKTVAAGEWIKDRKTNKDMAHDWVFAGSKFFKDPDRPETPPYYMANNGEFISLANFPDSMLDLPVKSPKDIADLIFEINTPRVPPLRTPVLVTLEPVIEKKK
jgi:hypothetical protein